MRVITEITYCDECGEAIPKTKKKDNKCIDETKRECRRLGIDLCDECAENILIKNNIIK